MNLVIKGYITKNTKVILDQKWEKV